MSHFYYEMINIPFRRSKQVSPSEMLMVFQPSLILIYGFSIRGELIITMHRETRQDQTDFQNCGINREEVTSV